MGKIRKGNYIYVSWIGDHGKHVHVFRDNRLIVKWDLERSKAEEGKMKKKIWKAIVQMQKESLL